MTTFTVGSQYMYVTHLSSFHVLFPPISLKFCLSLSLSDSSSADSILR